MSSEASSHLNPATPQAVQVEGPGVDPVTRPAVAPQARGRSARRWVGVGIVLLLAGVLGHATGLTEVAQTAAKRGFAAFLDTYAELYAMSAQEAGTAEYVIFLAEEDNPAAYQAFFAAESSVRFEREGGLPGTLVVTLLGDPKVGLERLKAQPFVQMALRNRGALFCH